MEKDKNQHKEPFRPEDTPSPPQNMRPGVPEDNNKTPQSKPQEKPDASKGPKKKLLGESEIEIDDETTI